MIRTDDGLQITVNVNVNINGKSITGGNSYQDASEEVQAAIATALYQYMNEGGTAACGSGIATPHRKPQASPWASKILTLRRTPRL